jgi:hypothetical protein
LICHACGDACSTHGDNNRMNLFAINLSSIYTLDWPTQCMCFLPLVASIIHYHPQILLCKSSTSGKCRASCATRRLLDISVFVCIYLAQMETPQEDAGKKMGSRALRELKNLTPFAWDTKSKHPPGKATLRDFEKVGHLKSTHLLFRIYILKIACVLHNARSRRRFCTLGPAQRHEAKAQRYVGWWRGASHRTTCHSVPGEPMDTLTAIAGAVW